jgi:hypothetical protein
VRQRFSISELNEISKKSAKMRAFAAGIEFICGQQSRFTVDFFTSIGH